MDVIVACATPWGRAAISVLRLSGPQARQVAAAVCPGPPRWVPRRASLRRAVRDGVVLDEVLVVWMPGPQSYTGEDVVELSCHGNPVVVELLLDALVAAGARPARPGEYTRRALENGRIDLLRAEAVSALIDATSAEGVALATSGLHYGLGAEVQALREDLLDLAAEVEARLDHPGEDLGQWSDARVVADLGRVAAQAEALARGWTQGRRRLYGARVALTGAVNAGKSSLFNALLGEARALVSPVPGTTRDVVEQSLVVDGLEIRLLDTAGERADAEPLEAEGQALGRRWTEDVDLRLIVVPLHRPLDPETLAILTRTAGQPRLVVGTHLDQGDRGLIAADARVSSTTGAGVADLRAALRGRLGGESGAGARGLLYSQRQHALCLDVAACARDAALALDGPAGAAVAAVEITRALRRLSELDGLDTTEAVLDRLFARFCIGK